MRKIYFVSFSIGLFVLLILIRLFLSVAGRDINKFHNSDPFYSSNGEWDGTTRFPLIKPYETTYFERENYWGMGLHVSPLNKEMYWYIGLHNVQKIAVVNDVILVYTPYKPDVSEELGEKALYWFVLIPSKDIEMGFDNEDGFLKYIQEYGINYVVWESPDTLYHRFLDTGCLEWIPGCLEYQNWIAK